MRRESIAIPITLRTRSGAVGALRTTGEPITMGLPFSRGSLKNVDELSLWRNSTPLPLQSRVLDRWPDNSLRWVLLDFQTDVASSELTGYEIRRGSKDKPDSRSPLFLREETDAISVTTGNVTFRLRKSGQFPFDEICVAGAPVVLEASRLVVQDEKGADCEATIERVQIEEAGSLRTAALVEGCILRPSRERFLEFTARLHFFAGLSVVKIALTVRNPRRASHPGGLWDLGDAGSVYIKDLSVMFTAKTGGIAPDVWWSDEAGKPLARATGAFELYQDSSGGENWLSSNHVNRHHRIPNTFRGYRVRSSTGELHGLRATPTVRWSAAGTSLAVAMPQFWQNFPKAIETSSDSLSLRLFPRQYADLHELQGGEQKTHTFFVAIGSGGVSEPSLAWCLSPLLASAEPTWYCSSGTLPYVTPAAENPNPQYLELVNAAVDGPDTFDHKREKIDEYGWRHFGEIYGDHETVFATRRTDSPLISHYNNQYDPIAGFGYQFLSTGDARWFDYMDELAAHVVDIDVYHTAEDKAAYNRGLFWHTFHYVDADTGTHRSYPAASKEIVKGGGPSAEHNYTGGLALHYFLTGNEPSRQTAVDLAQFVIDMDDGRKTIFRFVDRGYTGLASASGALTYHGPGRASANSLSVLLDAYRLSGEARFREKAEQLIRRCIHPLDDVAELNLLDAERKWFYTMFLQALGKYLDFKIDRGELDSMYAYGRESLLHYARWMRLHEYPYLEKPAILQYPTETWAAQDIRKSDVFNYAAKHAAGEDRAAFLERAGFIFHYSVSTLQSMPTKTFARPVVVLLTSGLLQGYFEKHPDVVAPEPERLPGDFGRPSRFTPQRIRAIRRVRALAAAAGLSALVLIGWLLQR